MGTWTGSTRGKLERVGSEWRLEAKCWFGAGEDGALVWLPGRKRGGWRWVTADRLLGWRGRTRGGSRRELTRGTGGVDTGWDDRYLRLLDGGLLR